jgi:hypothetical protein
MHIGMGRRKMTENVTLQICSLRENPQLLEECRALVRAYFPGLTDR